MTTATATPAKVHVEVPGFQGYGEFHGSTKDCSADAELMARHPLDGSPLDAATLNLWWGEYWNTGHHTSGGATLAHIYWHLTGSAHKLDATKARVVKFVDTDKVTLDALHEAIKAALAAGQTVIVYLGNALALPDNEHGVHGHFIALGGIDSDQGYLVGNGDEIEALGGHGVIPTHWVGWNQLVAAQVNGMIALEKVNTVVTTPTTTTIPTGWKDDGKTLIAPNGIPVVHGFRDYDAGAMPTLGREQLSAGAGASGEQRQHRARQRGNRAGIAARLPLVVTGVDNEPQRVRDLRGAGYPGAQSPARRRAGACVPVGAAASQSACTRAAHTNAP